MEIPKEIIELENTLRDFGFQFINIDREILIEGELRYANSFNSRLYLVVWKEDTKISFSEHSDFATISIMSPNKAKDIIVPKGITAYYNYPYLVIMY